MPALPESLEEALAAAAGAASAYLSGGAKTKKPGGDTVKARLAKQKARQRRCAVEVPLRDGSATATVELAWELVQKVAPEADKRVALLFADAGAADLAEREMPPERYAVAALSDGAFSCPRDAALAVVVGPRSAQAKDAERAVARVPLTSNVLLVNAEWGAEGPTPASSAFAGTFETVFAFQPLAIQGFFGTTEGAVYRVVDDGASAKSAPWRIFTKASGAKDFEPVARMAARPSNYDVETALYNASASKNPLNQAIKAVRQAADKGKK